MQQCNHTHEKESLESILTKIKNSGGRITRQRTDMIKTFLEFTAPFSAQELLDKMDVNSIDFATIYRSLNKFKELGVLRTVDFNDGFTRFEYISDDHSHHHHIICTECKAVEPIFTCTLDKLDQSFKKMGYTQISHKLEFFGLCQSCSA